MVGEEHIRRWTDEAEGGYDIEEMRRRGRGRPGSGAEPMEVVTVRLTTEELAAVDAIAEREHISRSEIGVLGVPGRADTVDELSELLRQRRVRPEAWYGVWLFVDWLDLSGAPVDPSDTSQLAALAKVELEAGRRDPYRQLSRAFHLLGRKPLIWT